MADKKSPGRFTLNFNVEDPKQRAAVSILNRLGRTKAQFITDAILHYMNCPGGSAIELSHPQTDEARIRQIVRELLLEQAPQKSRAPDSEAEEESAPAERLSVPVDFGGDSPFDEAQLAAIAKTMAAFQ